MLTFAVPALAAAGALAAAIPLLIHLLWRRRRRPVAWGAMELLQQAVRRTRRSLQLERWILLAVRMLLLLLLGFAVARPLLRSAALPGLGARTVYLVVDDGSASGAVAGDGRPILQGLRDAARSIVETLPRGDSVAVIAASTPPRIVLEPTADHTRAIERIGEIEGTLAPTEIAGAVEIAAAIASTRADAAAIVLLSGLRAGALPPREAPAWAPPEGVEWSMVALAPQESPIDNVAIAAIESGRGIAGSAVSPVRIRLERQGDLAAARSVIVASGPRLPTAIERTVRWAPGQSEAELELGVPLPALAPGDDPLLVMEIALDPDAQPADDRAFALLDARQRVRIGLAARRGGRLGEPLSGAGAWLAAALAPDPRGPQEIVEVDPAALDARRLRDLDAIVLPRPDLVATDGWAALRAFTDAGGLLVVLPPAEAQVHPWLDRLASAFDPPWRFASETLPIDPPTTMQAPTGGSRWLAAIGGELADLAGAVEVAQALRPEAPIASGDRILDRADGDPIVVAAQRGGGALVLFATAADLDWTTLPVRPLMVPLVQEILREGLALGPRQRQGAIGDRPRLADAAAVVEVRSPRGALLPVDESGVLERPLVEPGPHTALDPAGRAVSTFVVRTDPRAASTAVMAPDRAAALLGGGWSFESTEAIAARFGEDPAAGALSMLLLLAVLGLALLEMLLSRRFSHASGGEGAGRRLGRWLQARIRPEVSA
jgi:hypothetical protein